MNFAVRVSGWNQGKARSFAENIIPSNFHGIHFHFSMLHFSLNSEFLLTPCILIFGILSCPCIKLLINVLNLHVCRTSCSLVRSSRSRKLSSCGVFGTEQFSQIMRGKNRFETPSKTCHFGSATMGENSIS